MEKLKRQARRLSLLEDRANPQTAAHGAKLEAGAERRQNLGRVLRGGTCLFHLSLFVRSLLHLQPAGGSGTRPAAIKDHSVFNV